VEKVTHGIDEHSPRLTPPIRLQQGFRMPCQIKTVDILLLTHALKPARETLGIAELAAGTDFVATCNRIPSGIGPLDGGVISHEFTL
jgi:hypothetical protein